MGHHAIRIDGSDLPDLTRATSRRFYFANRPRTIRPRVARHGPDLGQSRHELTPEQKQECATTDKSDSSTAYRPPPEAFPASASPAAHRLRPSALYPVQGVRTASSKQRHMKPTLTRKNRRLEGIFANVHDTSTTWKIERQWTGSAVAKPHIPRAGQVESPDRSLVAQFISLSLDASKDS